MGITLLVTLMGRPALEALDLAEGMLEDPESAPSTVDTQACISAMHLRHAPQAYTSGMHLPPSTLTHHRLHASRTPAALATHLSTRLATQLLHRCAAHSGRVAAGCE